ALSSVLLLESIDLPDRSSADFGVSYLAANGGFQKLSRNKKFSYGLTYSYTNLSLVYQLIRQKFDYFKVPVVQEGDGNFRIKTSRTGMLKYFGSFSTTRVGFRNTDVDSLQFKDAFSLHNVYMYHNLSYKEKWDKDWGIRAGISYNNNHDQIEGALQDGQDQKVVIPSEPLYAYKNYGLDNRGNYVNAKVVLEKRWGALNAFRFGSEYNYSDERSDYSSYNGIHYPQDIRERIWAGFGESDVYLTNNIAAKIGVRAEESRLLDKWNVAPRLSLAYKFRHRGQFSLAYGIFYEDPESKYLPAINQLHFARATHYIAQYQRITGERTFRTEIFYKKYKDLFKTGMSGFGTFQAINNNGFGDARGVEFFWRDKKTIPNLDYWVSYSYLDTKRDFLNYPFAIQPSFATRHTASLVLKKFVTPIKTQFNASYTFATGRPYYDLAYDSTGHSFSLRNQGTTRDYNDLSLSINFLPSVGKTHAKGFIVYILSLTNVLGARNVYTYNFSANGAHKVAVTPPSTRFLYLGCFISIGVDRTQDEINNHL
ncbi:MAG: TonB-dependent receptor, partial [Bacteroidota bacterium]|nr:TonB-dependent receptor [Bacteroidota bacterium]